MAFTKIVSPGIDTTGSYTVQELSTVGVMTGGDSSGWICYDSAYHWY